MRNDQNEVRARFRELENVPNPLGRSRKSILDLNKNIKKADPEGPFPGSFPILGLAPRGGFPYQVLWRRDAS